MSILKKVYNDFYFIINVLGFLVFFRFLFELLISLPIVFRNKTLQVVDSKMGSGPFSIQIKKDLSFRVYGQGVFSGIREIFLRDVYLKRGLLQIKDNDIVVDLGANIGNFSNLALAHGPNVKVIAVEPSKSLNHKFRKSVGINDGFLDRVKLINSFFGSKVDLMLNKLNDDSDYAHTNWISEKELLNIIGINKIDFLKCDIEGGEFYLIDKESTLLDITKSFAVEIHSFAGDVKKFIEEVKLKNFKIISLDFAKDGTCILLAKKLDQI